MNRWQYRRVVVDGAALLKGEADEEMNRCGTEGWELVAAVSRERHGYQHEVCLLFKRMDRAGA
jgi:hypothetical protein